MYKELKESYRRNSRPNLASSYKVLLFFSPQESLQALKWQTLIMGLTIQWEMRNSSESNLWKSQSKSVRYIQIATHMHSWQVQSKYAWGYVFRKNSQRDLQLENQGSKPGCYIRILFILNHAMMHVNKIISFSSST